VQRAGIASPIFRMGDHLMRPLSVHVGYITSALCTASALFPVPTHAAISGVVAGSGYYQNAVVCIDQNSNGHCDAGEPSTVTDATGKFVLPVSGPIVAQIGTNASLFDPATNTTQPVTQALRFRGPAVVPAVASPVSTELQAMVDANGGNFSGALTSLANRLGVSTSAILEDPNQEADPFVRSALQNEGGRLLNRIAEATTEAAATGDVVKALRNRLALDDIQTIVLIYAENHSFDNVYGAFPNANGFLSAQAAVVKQVDRDGTTILPVLPPAWSGMTAGGQTPVVTQAQTTNVWPNAPFQIDAPTNPFGYGTLQNTIVTRDLYHRFFENVMQINGGKNDMYVAWADSGGLVMGYFDGSNNALWGLAKQYTLADNFFQAAYGGSFLNHQYLVCACAPPVSPPVVAANGVSINVLGPPLNGVPQLAANASQPASALSGPTSFRTGNVAPRDYFGPGDGYRAVNTMQPAYQPSGNKPVDNVGNHALFANPAAATTVPPIQTQKTIGDMLSAKGVDWAWYAGGWAAAVANPYPYDPATNTFGTSTTIYNTNSFGTADAAHLDFQAHHHPFNYFAVFDPVTHAANRAAHLKDRADLLAQAQAGTLPPVVFYKPVGFVNQHPGYANLTNGDSEVAAIVNLLQMSPQWPHMLIVVTYDEFGGQFDHVAPPKGDLLGPGTRIPALVISPFAKKGFVDHTQYDTSSFVRFVTNRYSLTVLPGLQKRDSALLGNGEKTMGDLTNALSF
jgi:acid phosphatase